LVLLSDRAEGIVKAAYTVKIVRPGKGRRPREVMMNPKLNRFVLAGALSLVWTAMAAAAEVPKFEVDPFWPKPLPHNWTLGQVGGVAGDEREHVWIIHRPGSLTP